MNIIQRKMDTFCILDLKTSHFLHNELYLSLLRLDRSAKIRGCTCNPGTPIQPDKGITTIRIVFIHAVVLYWLLYYGNNFQSYVCAWLYRISAETLCFSFCLTDPYFKIFAEKEGVVGPSLY